MQYVTVGSAWLSLWFASFSLAASAAVAEHESKGITIQAGVSQLFIDDYLIDDHIDLKRTLNQPVKDNGGLVPLIAAGSDTGLWAYGSIVYDDKLRKYVMFVREYTTCAMLRTTSADGVNWDATKYEDLGPVQFDLDLGELPQDVRGRFGTDLFSCYYDREDSRYPYKGWMWFANAGNDWEGIWYVRSADGLTWERPHQIVDGFATKGDPTCRVITQDGRTVYGPGDVTTFYYDAVEDRFLGLFKFFSYADVRPEFSSRCRAYAFMDRMDQPFDTGRITHVELMPAMAERNGDHLFDEYYASTAWRYESLWLGGLKIYHARGDYPFSAAGCAYLKLVVSRDGLHWSKVPFANDAGVPEVFIPNGTEGGNNGLNDGGYISEFSQGPLRVGDELIYYYTASSWGKRGTTHRLHGGGLFRSRLRVDGFVSVDWGTLTTKPLSLDGTDLTVNGIGPITIRVLAAGGNPLASTTVEDGDSLAHAVTFQGRSLGSLAAGEPIMLQFDVDWKGKLYSFKVH